IKILVLPDDASLHLIVDHGLAGERCLESDHRLNPGGGLGRAAIAPAPVVELCFSCASRLLAHLCQLFSSRVTAICTTGGQELFDHLAMPLGTCELINGLSIPLETEPGKALQNGVNGRLSGAFAIRVLDPQKHLSSATAGIKPVEQRSASSADV